MLSFVQGFIDWILGRHISDRAARARGLGAGRGCSIWLPIMIAFWAMVGVAVYKMLR